VKTVPEIGLYGLTREQLIVIFVRRMKKNVSAACVQSHNRKPTRRRAESKTLAGSNNLCSSEGYPAGESRNLRVCNNTFNEVGLSPFTESGKQTDEKNFQCNITAADARGLSGLCFKWARPVVACGAEEPPPTCLSRLKIRVTKLSRRR
jgi:hypothetical protein